MGYNSHWEGALTPSKTIPGEIVETINGSDTPPWTAARFESENEACIAARNHTDKTHRCEVVKTEALR